MRCIGQVRSRTYSGGQRGENGIAEKEVPDQGVAAVLRNGIDQVGQGIHRPVSIPQIALFKDIVVVETAVLFIDRHDLRNAQYIVKGIGNAVGFQSAVTCQSVLFQVAGTYV
ncbi:hypothetical protein Barb6_02292 [Bacteroidales bacterium Barb6]|nr:hypothetical protein Barb6_02292 [Bacteroidales bacterium Barb6]